MLIELLNVLAAVSGALMSIGYFPQAYKIWKNRSAHDVSLFTYVLFAVGTIIWLVYGIATRQWPIVAGFIIGVIGSLLVLILTFKYR